MEAFANLSRAFEYYAEAGNIALAVAAAEFPIGGPGDRIPGVAQLIARALTLVPAESHESGRLLSRYGGVLGDSEGDYEGGQEALGRAIAIARSEGDVRLEVQTLVYAADVSGRHLQYQESLDNGLRAIELATDAETHWSYLYSRWRTAVILIRMGNLDAARPHAMILMDLAEKRNTPRALASLGFYTSALLACLEGYWQVGREYTGRGLEAAPLNPQLLQVRVMLEHETGESTQGEFYLEQLVDAMGQAGPDQIVASGRTSMAIAAISRITGVPYPSAIAEAAAEAVLAEKSVQPVFVMFAKVGLSLLAVQNGDQSAAEEHYAYFLGQQGTIIGNVISVDRLLGLLSQTMGELDQSTVHFQDALSLSRKAGCRPELAWSCHDYAETLLEHQGPGHRAKAVLLLEEALAISTDLGMPPLMARVSALQEKASSIPEKAPAYPDGLTQREVEVLRLIASGKTDREIAEELVIGVRTVSTHVGNILNKTNAANRTEAASYANQQGLVSAGLSPQTCPNFPTEDITPDTFIY